MKNSKYCYENFMQRSFNTEQGFNAKIVLNFLVFRSKSSKFHMNSCVCLTWIWVRLVLNYRLIWTDYTYTVKAFVVIPPKWQKIP